jgi:hypothetical protein
LPLVGFFTKNVSAVNIGDLLGVEIATQLLA